jgi:hypothetical protein
MTATRRTARTAARLAATGLAVVLVAGGCGDDGGPRAVLVPELVDHDRDPTAGIAELDPARTDVLAAADLRLTIEQILGEHAWLAVDSSIAAAEGSPDVDPLLAAVTDNTTSLTGAIGLVYGPDGAGAVDELWIMHIQFFLDWAVARASDDAAGMARAERRLRDYEVDFASLLDTATEGRIPAEAAEALLAAHVAQVLAVIDAHLDGDASRAQAGTHEAYEYARVVGGVLAGGFQAQQPGVFRGELDDPATEARSALAADLGEWALLCADIGAPRAAGVADPETLAAAREERTGSLVTRTGQPSPATWEQLHAALADHAASVAAGEPGDDAALAAVAAALIADLAASSGIDSTDLTAPAYDLVAALAAAADATADPAAALSHRSGAYTAARELAAPLVPTSP